LEEIAGDVVPALSGIPVMVTSSVHMRPFLPSGANRGVGKMKIKILAILTAVVAMRSELLADVRGVWHP